MTEARRFSTACRRCERLARHLAAVRAEFPAYHARLVPPFGDARARLLIVGLAPGLHGANRTGRPFTGDYAGILLYDTLHRFGFADRAGRASRGRQTAPRRLPHHQCRKVPAPAEPARAAESELPLKQRPTERSANPCGSTVWSVRSRTRRAAPCPMDSSRGPACGCRSPGSG
jgi:uracil-DNA glycosylase